MRRRVDGLTRQHGDAKMRRRDVILTRQPPGLRMFEDAIMTARMLAAESEIAFSDWHLDLGSFDIINEREKGYSVWIALNDIPASSGSVSMCSNRMMPGQCRPLFEGRGLYNDSLRSWCDMRLSNACTNLTFRAGDAVVFSAMSVHRSLPVQVDAFERFALVGRFVDTRATYQESFWTSAVSYAKSYEDRTMHAMCQHGLVDKRLIAGSCFPRLCPEPEHEYIHAERLFVRRNIVVVIGASLVWLYRRMTVAPFSMGLLLLMLPKMLAICWKVSKKQLRKTNKKEKQKKKMI
eukprot:gnl/MRDRNA2_/MRDRNA2_78869_c0_seq1.p1 gnl/MRDRNA2_/MRDRNA2_78869_c0~~gnl/MRDRNA2_/MRDRNA2_78869_c0_seq1.p1  ORF type:complete len:292 (+),score=39.83 gnl/MRDRNA2_/MRDRNA2_78869_c0_seq1:76-951(+)